MSKIKTYRLHISPQTHVRTTKEERWMMSESITDEYLVSFGTKKYNEAIATSKETSRSPNDYLNRKNTIKRYFDYKRALKAEAIKQGFIIPEENVWFRFFIPMPKSWSNKKKNQKRFEQHKSRPDIDNISKGIFDSLLIQDMALSDYRASKFWADNGFIEIEVGGLAPAKGYHKYEQEDKIK